MVATNAIVNRMIIATIKKKLINRYSIIITLTFNNADKKKNEELKNKAVQSDRNDFTSNISLLYLYVRFRFIFKETHKYIIISIDSPKLL